MKNIYKILKTGGEALLFSVGRNPISTLYEIMSGMKKWAPYMQVNIEKISVINFINLWPWFNKKQNTVFSLTWCQKCDFSNHHSTDAVTELRNLLNDVGFVIKNSYCKPVVSGVQES